MKSASLYLRQSFAVVAMLCCLATVQGCVGTQAAYKAADGLSDTAYVATEHYSAVLKEAADIKESGRAPASAVTTMQRADTAVKPFIVGNPTAVPPVPSLKTLADRYDAVKSAENQQQLQEAVTNAVRELAGFIKAVKAAKGSGP